MHFVFEAVPDGDDWVAAWAGPVPDWDIGFAVICTDSRIKSCLAWSIHDAITTLRSTTPYHGASFTFEILFV
jgi:hypothetical protein